MYTLISTGFLPGVYSNNLNPFKAYLNYFQAYVERDLKQLIRVRELTQFENFMRLLAGRVGQIINLHSLSNDLGTSSATLGQWLSVLEASFIIIRVFPYHENFWQTSYQISKIIVLRNGIGIISSWNRK